jgi:hypothetical protein
MPNLVNTFYKPYRASLTHRPFQATVVAKTGAAVKNNGGTFFAGGLITAGASAPFITYSNSLLGIRSGFNGSVPYLISDENIGTTTAISSGNFAQMEANQYILFGYTKKVAGIANAALSIQGHFGAGSPGESRALEFLRTSHYVLGGNTTGGASFTSGGWDYITGWPLVNPLPNSQNWVGVSPSGQAGSYKIPGRLSFIQGAKTPLVVSYSAKND